MIKVLLVNLQVLFHMQHYPLVWSIEEILLSHLSLDFFDSGASKSTIEIVRSSQPVANPAPPTQTTSALPEGFFDNPEVDARMRKVEYVNKMEVEWDAFTREMKQEANVRINISIGQDFLSLFLDIR